MLNRRKNSAGKVERTALKTPEEIEKIYAAGRVARKVIALAQEIVQPGMTTGELEDRAAQLILEHGGTSPCLGYAPSGYPPYPAWTCISVNEEIVHGIPGGRVFRDGDLVTMDCCVRLDGYVADTAFTFGVGEISPLAANLLQVTSEALYIGIGCARPGNTTGDIGAAIQKFVEANHYSVVRELHGHGVGREMHENAIDLPNYGRPETGLLLEPGMTFAIEPMVNAGRKEIKSLRDGWTIVTADGSLSAHFEHTVAITEGGVRILTGP